VWLVIWQTLPFWVVVVPLALGALRVRAAMLGAATIAGAMLVLYGIVFLVGDPFFARILGITPLLLASVAIWVTVHLLEDPDAADVWR
jgi:hypothetical protein